MPDLNLLLAAAATPRLAPEGLPEGQPSKILGMSVKDLLMLVGVALILANVLFLWAYFTRKKRRSQVYSHSRAIYRPDRHRSEKREEVPRMRHKRRKRTHPDHWPRNPTLGDTGGLPPLRPEEPTEPTQ